MVTKKLLHYVSDVGSESLHRKIGDNNTLHADTSFISETNYCGMSCIAHLWQT